MLAPSRRPALDVTQHPFHLRLVDYRAELRRRIERIAGLAVAAERLHFLQQRVLDAFLQQQARAGGAHLALVGKMASAAALAALSRSG